MAKGAKGKSSATSATKKKHARKHAQPSDDVPTVKVKKGKKKDKKEPRKKVYIPPVKPAPIQPDPLETTGLAHTLPADLLVILRSFNKKAQVTKIRALEDLNLAWIEKAINEGPDSSICYTLVEMLPVWMHHVPSMFVHPSRRVRLLAASVHSSLLSVQPVREQLVFFLRETASDSQVERIVGSWCMLAHDGDRNVALAGMKSLSDAFGPRPSQIPLGSTLRRAIFDFVEQMGLNPEGVYNQLNPVQPSVPVNHPQSKKGQGKSVPSRPFKKTEEEAARNKMDEDDESIQDKKARLRISALGALSFLLKSTESLSESAVALYSNPAFLTCLYPGPNPPWVDLDEAFGNGQPFVRKAMWDLLHTLISKHKEHLGSSHPVLSKAMLRSAWVEPDASVQNISWQTVLPFVKEFPSAWEIAGAAEAEAKEEEEESESEDESDDEAGPSIKAPAPSTIGTANTAYIEFLQFLRTGCGGSPVQGYPIVVIVVATIPSKILFSSSFSGLGNFFTAFWEALDSRALTSLDRELAAASFTSSLLESMAFAARRLLSPPTDEEAIPEDIINDKVSELVNTQIRKVWQEVVNGNLKVPESHLAKSFSKALAYLQRVKAELYDNAWSTIREITAISSKSHPSLVASFLRGLSEAQNQEDGGDHDALLVQLSNEALSAYEDESALASGKQLLPDLLSRFQGELFKDDSFVQRLDTLLEEKAANILETDPSLILAIMRYRKDAVKVDQLWHRVLIHIASPCTLRLSILSTVLDALKQGSLPKHLTPPGEGFDSVVSELLREALASTGELGANVKVPILKALLQNSQSFVTPGALLATFITIVTSLQFQIAQVLDGSEDDEIPFSGLSTLLDLTLSTYPSLPSEAVSTMEGLEGLMIQVFIYGKLLPHCQPTVEDKSFTLAKQLWSAWYESKTIAEAQKVAVLQSVKERLKALILSTSTPRVSPQAILSLLSERNTEFEKGDVLEFLPSEGDLSALLASLSPLPIDPSMAVLDPLLKPSSTRLSTSNTAANDRHGFSSYARGVYALLQYLSANRTLAKKNLWALRHFIALSIYAHDFQSVPGANSPLFDGRALGLGGTAPPLSEIVSRVDQITTYLLISSSDEDAEGDWRKYAAESLLNDKETAKSRGHALSSFVVQVMNEAKRTDAPRETRILRVVLDHVLDDDMEMLDGDMWIQLARKLERSAPETSLSIIYSATQARLESPKLDRYRNEVAASLLGIPPTRVNTEGLFALRKLAASAPDPDSDVVFLPQLRAVNAVKACQKWVEEAGGDDEDDEDEGGVGEEVENAMLPVFVALAPILQNDQGKHWEFIFDLVENVLENSSVTDDDTLVGLSRALKMVAVIEDLCSTNKGLRAEWDSRKPLILGSIRDLAGAKLEDKVASSVSLPRSVCRESLLEIVQSLPASLIDHETLAKMCHLITDPSVEVQKMAYRMLKMASEKRTEYLVIEVGVGNFGGEQAPEELALEPSQLEQPQPKPKKKKKEETKDKRPRLLPVELIDILNKGFNFAFGVLEQEEEVVLEQEQDVFGWMLGWMLVFDLFTNASFKVKSMYIEQLRNHDLVGSNLLPNIVQALHLDRGLSKAFKIQQWGVDEFYVQYFEPSIHISIPVLAAHLYYRALLCVPSLVHTWVLDCKDRQLSTAITSMTSQFFSPLIIQAELAHVRSPEGVAELTGEGMTVRVVGGAGAGTSGGSANEVVASYAVDEHQLEIRLRIPPDWPLHKIEIGDEKRVGVDENRWRAWVLGVQQTIWTHNGRIVDGLGLFKKNVTLHFEGQVECAICYSIISVMDGSLPKKPCKTCKNRFHAVCLYKWFNTSHSSSCPLCRTNII